MINESVAVKIARAIRDEEWRRDAAGENALNLPEMVQIILAGAKYRAELPEQVPVWKKMAHNCVEVLTAGDWTHYALSSYKSEWAARIIYEEALRAWRFKPLTQVEDGDRATVDCWLIEADNKYWTAATGVCTWTHDPWLAIRFCRQEDAERVRLTATASETSKAVQHSFEVNDPMLIKISCDKVEYSLPKGCHTGSNLRAFFGVPSDKDLYIQLADGEEDALIPPSDLEIDVENRDRFYTVSRKIIGG